jgi:hypothetical protein
LASDVVLSIPERKTVRFAGLDKLGLRERAAIDSVCCAVALFLLGSRFRARGFANPAQDFIVQKNAGLKAGHYTSENGGINPPLH